MFRQQRVSPVQRIPRLFQLRCRALDTSLSGLDSEFQLLVLRASDFYLLVQSCKRGFRSIQRLLIIGRIDFEKQIALFNQLVVLNGEFNDLAAGAWNDSDDIRARGGIIRAGVPLDRSPYVECEQNGAGDDCNADNLANELSLFGTAVRGSGDALFV